MNKTQLWKDWAASFGKAKTEPMSHELSQVFMVCMLMELDVALPGPIEDEFLYKVYMGRKNLIGLSTTYGVDTLVASLASAPGDVVMWAYFLKSLPDTKVTMTTIVELFPMGFPTVEEMHRLWVAQKCFTLGIPGDNLLDQLSVEDLEEKPLESSQPSV